MIAGGGGGQGGDSIWQNASTGLNGLSGQSGNGGTTETGRRHSAGVRGGGFLTMVKGTQWAVLLINKD